MAWTQANRRLVIDNIEHTGWLTGDVGPSLVCHWRPPSELPSIWVLAGGRWAVVPGPWERVSGARGVTPSTQRMSQKALNIPSCQCFCWSQGAGGLRQASSETQHMHAASGNRNANGRAIVVVRGPEATDQRRRRHLVLRKREMQCLELVVAASQAQAQSSCRPSTGGGVRLVCRARRVSARRASYIR